MPSENQQGSQNQLPVGPRHVAIIMDGNGRWAKHRGKLRIFGHQAGVKSVRRAVSFSVSHHLDALTLYAFSSENWNRPTQEVTSLMELFVRALDSEVKNLHKHNVRLRIIGDISRFNTRLQERIRRSEHLTENNTGLTLNIAANYGGRWDIIQSVRKIAEQVQEGVLRPDTINEETLCRYICLSDLSPVDLVIRTGGEHRISNFLLWQIAYAELYFTDVLWPDFDEQVFEGALNAFAQRERRFGGTTPIDTDVS
ncbi:(2E,6E)-farnesyl-diphosphate-specific ditrans,polycis-undecaprenyl-diphosphate synthase [Pectobacteriaceae bacterium CE70]|uniref:Ditrans,polycis-undecaprenyl-diphosphate synthase ((2E,6E)-farnesyl-diphosphate specific) n=1 Tax=Serratia sp. (strain ATCC 39006) TaxID=104623 RepID=A0A2I5TNH1_SERS3|nr:MULTISPECIES: (2E,6E)-farnesyl-diphosphate-specific ditrans,polycis-undecaprenyl-diphosphate synthase [Enterobacterales]WJV59339.1 (2E,6E)-farnesyl-diphosphate-specific ditrans,polycis-undecaprenyl-diphosphate synthase [Pectobacteriaceae bacterium C111]WJV63586.1 (2E,6E)-farnesyl-diphosphate-specific ditrans,polycis-undecaprenyl-diphosphate synthase [Pectobacteriaceae bacterium C52]WJV67977.1 (2E,6E)-farnesyl-diphosphate-specific ditrans,polycis-undecaprenyl-diphosphate synthase [Pectobacteri